jgi:hypothetical protein
VIRGCCPPRFFAGCAGFWGNGDLETIQKEKAIVVELIDCAGNLVDRKKLTEDAFKLEKRVRALVGPDNFYVDPPEKVPKIITPLSKTGSYSLNKRSALL